MDDYISRQSAIEAIEVFLEKDAKIACLNLSVNDPQFSRCMARYNGIKAARQIIEKIPSADVRQVVHGKWYFAEDAVFRCSVCGRICPELDAPYCNCGADMSGNKSE